MISPPRHSLKKTPAVSSITTGLLSHNAKEAEKLEAFLNREIKKFKNIQGPTDQAYHHLELLDDRPIK